MRSDAKRPGGDSGAHSYALREGRQTGALRTPELREGVPPSRAAFTGWGWVWRVGVSKKAAGRVLGGEIPL